MLRLLGIFDPGWRDLSVRMSNTEITIIWILAALLGALLYHFFIGRRGKLSAAMQARFEAMEKEVHDEKQRQHRLKQQLEAAQAKANSFVASAAELDKLKHRLHDMHKEQEHLQSLVTKHQDAFTAEHAKVTSMIVDHSEVEALRNRVKNQEKELHQLRDDISRQKTALDAAVADKVRLAASLDESQVAAMREKINRLENDLHSSRLMVVKYQSEARQLEEDREKVRAERQDLDQQSGETAGFRQRISQLEADLQKARTGLADRATLEAERDALKVESANWKQEADVQARNAAAALALESRIAGLEGQVRQMETDASALRAALDQANLEKATLAEALAKANGPIRPDNLKVIEGIGPKLEEMLNANRIYTFRQLADTPVAVLQGILDEAGETYRIHDPGTWPEQANLLSEGKLEAFEKLTEELKGGRRVD